MGITASPLAARICNMPVGTNIALGTGQSAVGMGNHDRTQGPPNLAPVLAGAVALRYFWVGRRFWQVPWGGTVTARS